MRKSTLAIHSENILPIIKKWLYSSRDIFLRELVSNACDAIKKLRVLRECNQAPSDDQPFEIHVHLDSQKKILTISDNGIGMTEEEVEKYIAQIAFSSAEDFVSKYKEQSDKDPMIGHFGLGFYSAYMVASRVELQTQSYLVDAPPVQWSCDGSPSYEIGKGTRTERGTDIILHLEESCDLDEVKIRELLKRFCFFLPDPIFFNGQPLGNETPLWLKSPTESTDQEILSFYRKLYPAEPDPLFWIHLNIDYPFRLKGILYFPKAIRNLTQKAIPIKLFCNRVFVSDDCRDILPDYLTILCGAIDSPDIPLNVSRSYLQVDQNVRQLGAHIAKKVADRLSTLFKSEPERNTYTSYWPQLELFLKLGMLHDDKFYERVHNLLIWKNSAGQWTTLQEYLDRAKEKKIYYCGEDCATAIQKAYLDRGIELIYTAHSIDTPIIMRLEEKASMHFQRIDSALDPALLDETREKTLLDADGKTDASRIADLFRSNLSSLQPLEVEAKSLASDAVAGILLIDENLRRMRDYMTLTQQEGLPQHLAGKRIFVVNTNNKLVQMAWRLSTLQPELSKQMIGQIYDLARVMQKEVEPMELDGIFIRNQQLLEQLVSLLPP